MRARYGNPCLCGKPDGRHVCVWNAYGWDSMVLFIFLAPGVFVATFLIAALVMAVTA